MINHLWMGWVPQDVDKGDQLRQLGEMYWACGKELQVSLQAMATPSEHWVDVALLLAWAQVLVDMYSSLGYCR